MLILLAMLALQPAAAAQTPPRVELQAAVPADVDAAVRSAASAYLDAHQQGRFDAAWVMVTPERQANRPRAAWEADSRNFRREAGAFGGRRLGSVTLLDNPGGVQGVFAAIGYDADYANAVFVCGILIWRREPDGGWRLFRERSGGALRADFHDPTPASIAEGRRHAGCLD